LGKSEGQKSLGKSKKKAKIKIKRALKQKEATVRIGFICLWIGRSCEIFEYVTKFWIHKMSRYYSLTEELLGSSQELGISLVIL
jgi:hypothetical protein